MRCQNTRRKSPAVCMAQGHERCRAQFHCNVLHARCLPVSIWLFIRGIIIIIIIIIFIAHANGSYVGTVVTGLSVFPDDMSKSWLEFNGAFVISRTDAARIAKLDLQMLHDESGKPISFGVKRSQCLCQYSDRTWCCRCTSNV